MRRLALVLALVPCGCLAEYVLPGDGTLGSEGDETGEQPTTGDPGDTSSTGDDGDLCAPGLARCGDECVDLGSDPARCGSCEEVCKDDERCIAGECRDVLLLECSSCPCPDQCPQKDPGVLEATSGDPGDSAGDDGGGGDSGEDAEQHLCCEAQAEVICVIADLDETLVCP